MGTNCRRKLSGESERPFFSICIPCFNAGVALSACLRSISAQDTDDYEVIIIDDGSKTPLHLEDYLDCGVARLKIERTGNGGPYAARRRAFDIACGEVVLCVDADDGFANSHALSAIWKVFKDKDPDIVIFNATTNGVDLLLNFNGLIETNGYLTKDSIGHVFATDFCLNTMWSKAFKRALCGTRPDDTVPPRLLMAEDRLQSLEVILEAKSFCLINEPLYDYRNNSGSTTRNSYLSDYFFQSCYVEEKVVSSLDDLGVSLADWAQYYLRQISSALRGICCNSRYGKAERHDIFDRMNTEVAVLTALQYGDFSRLPRLDKIKLSLLCGRRYVLLDLFMLPRVMGSKIKHRLYHTHG